MLAALVLGWAGCSSDDEIHPLKESYTAGDGTVYTVFHLEVAQDLDSLLTVADQVDMRLMNMSDRSISNIRIERDTRKKNCLIFYIPEKFAYKEGLYQTYQARRNGLLFTFPLKMECDNGLLTNCMVSTMELTYAYEKLLVDEGDPIPAGTADDPFMIDDFDDLRALRACVENDLSLGQDRHFRQTAHIKVDNDDLAPGEEGWQPIGFVKSVPYGFAGHYDGNKKEINGLHLLDPYTTTVTGSSANAEPANYLGLFSQLLKGATVKNLTIQSFVIDAAKSSYIGAVCGLAEEGVEILDVKVKNSTFTGEHTIGGVAGSFQGSLLKNCSTDQLLVTATGNCVGGIAGEVVGSTTSLTIEKCRNDGTTKLIAQNAVGGIVGNVRGTVSLTGCTNRGYRIEARESNAGGIVGQSDGTLKMTECVNDLAVGANQVTHISLQAAANAGGLVGLLCAEKETSLVDRCESYASLTATEGKLGGLIGMAKGFGVLHILNSLCGLNGQINIAGSYAGGVIGLTEVTTLIENTGNRKEANNANLVGGKNVESNYVGGLVGCSTSSLQLKSVESTGYITVAGNHVGGLVGQGKVVELNDASLGVVTVEGSSMVGGLIGSIIDGSFSIQSDTSRVLFNGHIGRQGDLNISQCGGILGYAYNSTLTLTNVKSTGHVSGSTDVGGLIGKVEKGVKTHLKGCVVSGVNGIHGINNVGGLVASLYSSEIALSGCLSYSPVHGSGDQVGGIVGLLESLGSTESLLRDCKNHASVTGASRVAGLVAYLSNPQTGSEQTLRRCTNTGAISGSTQVGGCIGLIADKNCKRLEYLFNEGAVVSRNTTAGKGDNSNVGGVLARCHSDLAIWYCHNTGAVDGNACYSVGGIVGRMGDDKGDNQKLRIDYSFNTGEISVSGNSDARVGGIVGKMESVKSDYGIFDCYNTMKIVGSKGDRGGIAGVTDWNVDIDRCYYAGANMGGKAIVADGKAKMQRYHNNYILNLDAGSCDQGSRLTEEQFKTASNFKNWDFASNGVWCYAGTPKGARPVLRHNEE